MTAHKKRQPIRVVYEMVWPAMVGFGVNIARASQKLTHKPTDARSVCSALILTCISASALFASFNANMFSLQILVVFCVFLLTFMQSVDGVSVVSLHIWKYQIWLCIKMEYILCPISRSNLMHWFILKSQSTSDGMGSRHKAANHT